ncbi:MAG: transglutaminase domain-containing protein, partial [Clostridia bacterium]|nr:transglutaminase domain-containing protein [Clostridia bacterium]
AEDLSYTEDVSADRLVNGHYVKYDGKDKTQVQDVTSGEENIYQVLVFNENDQDITYNYDIIDYVYGKLIVTARPVDITTASNSWVYDGRAHFDATFESVEQESEDRGLLADKGHQAEYKEDGIIPTTVFDVTEQENVFDVIITAQGEDKTFNYEINLIKGTLKVTKRHIEIFSSGSAGNVYDGTVHRADGYQLFCLEEGETVAIPECDQLDVTITGYQEDVGTSPNTFTYTIIRKGTGLSSADNYQVKETCGTIEVIPREIKVQTGTKEFVFDGNVYDYTDYAVVIEGSLVLDHKVEYNDGYKTQVRNVSRDENGFVISVDNVYEVRVVSANGEKTKNYKITYDYGKLTVTPINALIFTATTSWIYDGEEHSDVSVVDTVGLLQGHTAWHDGGAFVTVLNAVDVKDNEFKVNILSSYGNETVNYEISYDYGVLSIDKREITAKLVDAEKVYEGIALTSTSLSFEWTYPEKTVYGQTPEIIGHEYIADAYGEQLFVGTSENVLLGVTVKCKGQDVSENYDFKYENGLLTVLVRPISIRPADREKTYDGTPLVSDNSFWITSEYGIAWGDTLSIVAPGEITKVGELQYYITEYAFMRDGVDVSWNYDVDYLEHGTLKINPKPITIISGSNTRMYDGTPIISHELVGDATFDGTNFRIVDTNEIITASFTGWQIEVEEVSENNYFTIDSIVDKDGEDSMGNYVITTKNGTLKATPRPITVNTGSKIFTFDKQTHYYSDCPTAGGYGLVLDHVVAYDGGERTEVRNVSRDAGGQVIGVANCYQVRVLSAEGDKTHNYQISYDNGSITILPIDVTVVTATNSWDYDGEIHFDTNIVSYSGFLDGDTPYYDELGTTEVRDVLYDSNGRVVGKANIFGVKVISSDDLDETVNYEITYDYGTLTINAIEINIKPIDMEKYYDGTPLINENGEFEYLDDVRLPSGVSISIETDGYFVGPGKTEYNIIAYEITKDGQPVGSNYIVNVYPGTLKVIKEITITTESAEKVYDGVALTDDRVYVEGSTIEGEYLIVTVIGSQTDAGESENDCLIEIVDANGEIIDGAVDKYEWLFDYGTLKVTKRSVFYSSPSDIKFYDGVEFYNDQMEFMPHDGDTGLLPNHQIVALVTTRILYPGVEDNLIEAFSVECDGRNVTDNYVLFVKEVGTLEVTGRLITVTTENDIKAYDGAPLENSNYSYEGDLLEGHQVVVEVTGSQTEIGESDNTAIVDIIDQNGKSVMDLYAVKVETGTLTVMPEDGGLPDGSVPSSGKGQQDGEYKDVEWYKVLSSKDGRIYLRMTSYGDYDGQGWGDAVNYQGSTSISPLGYASLALANAGMAFDTVTISKMFTGAPYVLPYYVDARTLGNRNDAFVNNPGQTYNLNYVLARDLAEIVEMLPNASLPIQYRNAEELYRKHVHKTYLQLPEYTKEEMLKVIERHNLDANNPEILLQVAELVQRQVAYSKTFSYEGDIAVYFFNGAETGICSHYSTAATALFRALGIPARYVGGITGEVTAGEESIISGELHAWVEVYIDGVGWIQVEVTGSGDGSGGSGGSGENEGEGSEGENGENGGNGGSGNNGAGNAGNGGNGKQEFYIKPVDVIEKFVSVGTVVYAEQKVESSKENLVDCFAEFKKEGYTWEFRVEGQLIATQEGVDFEGESNIVYFVLYDRNGNILFSTDNNPDDNQIIINMLPGSILITNKDIVELYLFYKEKVYSGNTVSYSPDEYYIKEKPDFIGEIVFNLQGSLSTPGTLLIEDLVNESTFKAYDLDGNLLVYGEDYIVEVIGIPLTITRRSITISSSSASFKYNGKEQTANSQKDATITMGSLIDGHTMKVTISGAITDVGTKENTIESVVIFDAQGNNVTDYYNIILKPGTLVVY